MGRRAGDGRWRVTGYVTAVILLGTAAAVAAVLTATRPLAGGNPTAFALYAGCILLAELAPLRALRHHDGTVTGSWAFSVALLLSAPLSSAILVVAGASLIGDAVSRRTVPQAAFNAAQLCICLALGGGFLRLVADGHPLSDPTGSLWPYLPLAMVAAAIVYASNTVLTMAVLALDQQVPVLPMLRRGFSTRTGTDLLLLGLAPIFVVIAARSLLLLPLLLLTAWAVYGSAANAVARQHEALHDALTDLPNRRMFHQRVAQALVEAGKRGHNVAIVVVDLDGFKEINDRLGHHIGDEVLQVVASRFQGAMQPQDLVARLGGDEFAVLLHGIESPAEALLRAKALLLSLESPCIVQGFPVGVGGSVGVALCPDHAETTEGLLQAADRAMYHAKSAHLGIAVFAKGRDHHGHGRVSLLASLREAVEEGSLHLHYQPKLQLRDRRVTGVEALIRWDHPTEGPISPADFMPLAEHTELMPQLTAHVLRVALRQTVAWRAAGLDLTVAVNGSARDLVDPRFVGTVAQILDETGLPAEALEIELTEHGVMADPRRTSQVMTALRAMGVAVSIDDFGTGFSSLTSLRDLPIDRVKLDQTYVTAMTSTPRDLHIVRSILALARGLGIEAIAEGVETADALEELDRLGCEAAQGFLISRPLPAEELTPWLLEQRLGLRIVPEQLRVLR